MSYSKVVYIRYIPLTRKIYEDFYMQEVKANVIDIEYWDVSAIFYSSNFGQEDSSNLMKTIYFDKYESFEMAISSLKECKRTLFISLMTFEKRIVPLFSILTKYNCTVAGFGRNMLPVASGTSRISFVNRLKRFTYSKLVDYLSNRLMLLNIRSGKLKTYDIAFLAGSEGYKALGCIPFSSIQRMRKISINSTDYDIYLTQKKEMPIIDIDYEYILFLDEYLPFHPDWFLLGTNMISAERYYKQLNRYFEKVESTFGKPIIIAAHPKALNYKENNYFNGRKVYFGITSQLTKNADFVIAHMSTSISYSILCGKRLHFITSQDIKDKLYTSHSCIISFARYLSCNYQYFDKEEAITIVEKLPISSYMKYKNDFLTSDITQNIESKDIFINFLMGSE